MNSKTKIIFIFLIIALFNKNAFCQETISPVKEVKPYSVNPFTNLGQNFIDCFTGNNLWYHLGGIAATPAIIYSGIDYKVHNYFADADEFRPVSAAIVAVGTVMPIVLSGGLLVSGLSKNSPKEKAAASAAIQASLISLVYASTLKFFTGRPNPKYTQQKDNSLSKTFRFGFNRGGVYFGWPSSHMMINTAVTTSIMYFYKDNKALNTVGNIYLGCLFLCVLSHNKSTMHWASDTVAGTLMGFAIGSTIGKNFRNHYDNCFSNEKTGYKINVSPEGVGLSLSYLF